MEPESAGSYEQELKPHAEIFLSGGWEEGAPNWNFSKLLELPETSQARKLIFGLRVNIDKANTVADMRLPSRSYIQISSKYPQSAHQCTVYILWSQV